MSHRVSLNPTRPALPSVRVCLVIRVFFDGWVAEKFVGDLKLAFSIVFAHVFPLVSVCLVGFHIFPTSSFVFPLVEPLAIMLHQFNVRSSCSWFVLSAIWERPCNFSTLKSTILILGIQVLNYLHGSHTRNKYLLHFHSL